MGSWLAYTVIGLFTGAAYAIAASGLVLTYSTTRVFNVAHGAFGMVLAFVYWDLSQKQHIPVILSLIIVLLLVAPALGFLVQRTVARGLGRAPVSVALVVTVGLLVACIGIATQIWPPAVRSVPPFFPGKSVTLGSVTVTYHQIITIVLSGVVAAGLYLLLNRTRIGTAMRASVDNPDLLELYGGRPQWVAGLSWAIGTSMAGLAGILLTSVIGLQYYDLTLLVISAYAAAMLGRLVDLRMTFVGAMALGLLQSYAVGYLPTGGTFSGVRAVVPTLFLFIVILAMPQATLRIGQVKGLISAPVPTLRNASIWGVALVLVVAGYAVGATTSSMLLVGTAMTYAIVMLSMVLLTGFGGHVSLAQFTFAGVGALAYAKLDQPNLLGLVLAVVIAAAVGALVALPVLRLTGLYLALATLAFAQLMDKLIFQSSFAFKYNGMLDAKRLSIFGWQASGTGSYAVVMTVVFVLTGLLVIACRRGRVVRLLIAMRDSPAAAGTLGLDQRWWRVGLFAASAGIAGLAGALFAGLRQSIGANDFQFFTSLLVLLVAVVFGVTTVTGALLGGFFLMELPVLQADHPSLAGLAFVVLGLGAVLLARDPNGLANRLFALGHWSFARLHERVPQLEPAAPATQGGAQ